MIFASFSSSALRQDREQTGHRNREQNLRVGVSTVGLEADGRHLMVEGQQQIGRIVSHREFLLQSHEFGVNKNVCFRRTSKSREKRTAC